MAVFIFLCKMLVFLFLPLLNLGTKTRCPQNRYTNLKSALDQPLTTNVVIIQPSSSIQKKGFKS